MHALILIGLVFIAAVVWTFGILLALNRLAGVEEKSPDTHPPGPGASERDLEAPTFTDASWAQSEGR